MFHPVASCGECPMQEVLEEGDHFLSFAKRSRTVQRRSEVETPLCPPSSLQPSSSVRYNQAFWDRILQWPSSLQTEECPAGPVDLGDGAAECQPSLGLKRLWGAGLGPGSLPTPNELIGRRRTRGRRGGGAQRGEVLQLSEATVLHHISDLKRRQSSIDQLKTERCWGFMVSSRVGESGVAGLEDLSQDWVPDLSSAPFTPNLPHHSLQTAFGEEVQQNPGEDPMMAFVMATADRQDGCKPHLSNEEFWGFGFDVEE